MTTLKREIRDKLEGILSQYNDLLSQAEIEATAELQADAVLEVAGIKSAEQRRKEVRNLGITSHAKAEQLICNAAGFGAAPSKFREHFETVLQLIDKYGETETAEALKEACNHWGNTKRVDKSRNYSALNPAWIDWAISYLAGEAPWATDETPADDAAHPEFKKWVAPDIKAAPPPKELPSFMRGK